MSYGELAGEANLKREATVKVAPKPPDQHKIVGKPIQRLDIPAKVTGGAAFVQDIRLPGMLHGRVVRPPRYGAKLESFDEAKVKVMPGVVAVVRDGSFLGVVAEREEQAINARLVAGRASAKWQEGPPLPDPAWLCQELMAMPTETRGHQREDRPRCPQAAKVVEATYHRPYQAHGSLAPSCCGGGVQGRQADGVDAQPGCVPTARHHGPRAGHAAGCDPLHPC